MSVTTPRAAGGHHSADQPTKHHSDEEATMPSEVTGRLAFRPFATGASHFTSRAWFFALCMLLVIPWAPSFVVFGSIDTWQLVNFTACLSLQVGGAEGRGTVTSTV